MTTLSQAQQNALEKANELSKIKFTTMRKTNNPAPSLCAFSNDQFSLLLSYTTSSTYVQIDADVYILR